MVCMCALEVGRTLDYANRPVGISISMGGIAGGRWRVKGGESMDFARIFIGPYPAPTELARRIKDSAAGLRGGAARRTRAEGWN